MAERILPASDPQNNHLPYSPTSEWREEFKCCVKHPSLGVLCDKERGHTGDHRGYIEQHDAVEFWPQAAPSDLSGFSEGPWTACRMVHEDRGDDLTPEELGEYVKNSVIKSAQASGSTAFLFVSCEKPDGPADVCHVGNGPTSPANARLIAAAPDLLRENTELRASLTATQAEIERLKAERRGLRILMQWHDGTVGVRGIFASQADAESEIQAIIANHGDLGREDFIIQVERVRGRAQ